MGLPQINREKTYKKMPLLSGLQVSFRPWKVGDKKDFLIQMELAKGDKEEMKKIMMILIENCLENPRDVDEMSNNDILQILAEMKKHAEGDLIDFAVSCPHCKVKNKDIQISISEDIEMKPFESSPIIINDRLSAIVRDLPEKERIELKKRFGDSEVEFNFYFLVNSIVAIMEGDEMYKNFTEAEMVKWIDDLDDFDAFAKLGGELGEKRSSFIISKIVECSGCGKKINTYFNEPERFFVL